MDFSGVEKYTLDSKLSLLAERESWKLRQSKQRAVRCVGFAWNSSGVSVGDFILQGLTANG